MLGDPEDAPHRVRQAKARQVGVGVQIRRDARAHACCPRHNELFCVFLSSSSALWQYGSEQSSGCTYKLVNVAHPRCQRSLARCGCYPACRRHGLWPAREGGHGRGQDIADMYLKIHWQKFTDFVEMTGKGQNSFRSENTRATPERRP